MSQFIEKPAERRFELIEEGGLAFADFRVVDEILILPHVETVPALRGRGAAGRLMAGILAVARERGLKVRPVCGYAAAYIQRHTEYHDLLE